MPGMMTDEQIVELVRVVNSQRFNAACEVHRRTRKPMFPPEPLTVEDVTIILGAYTRLRYQWEEPCKES